MLPFEVDATSNIPLWIQLRNRIAYLISSGHFQPGDQLPTVRALASDICINYNTVNKAYMSLMREGYITSTRGRGAFVNDLDAEESEEQSEVLEALLDDCIAACSDLGLSLEDIEKAMLKRIRKLEKEKGAIRYEKP